MKVIFSRKGFDSGYGGMPSPILPNGQMLSIPIPADCGFHTYKDLRFEDKTYLDLMKSLGKKVEINELCHLDPDIYKNVVIRSNDWRPLFGQEESAQGHLRNQGIKKGDLFLFFGWFRKTVAGVNGVPVWDKNDKQDKHVLFGYLEIGEIHSVNLETKLPAWMLSHPHSHDNHRKKRNNTIYVANKNLTLDKGLPGAGSFCFSDKIVLTKSGKSRSFWHLPSFFKDLQMTYNPQWGNDYVRVPSKGQEFVVHGDGNKELEEWVLDIIRASLMI